MGEAHRAGEPEGHILIEVDDEHLVVLIAGPHERAGAGNHIRDLRPHAPAVIDNQAYRDRNIFVAEQPDGLPDAVFIELKILLAEIGDQATLAVADRSLQNYQVDVYGDF